MKELYNCVHDVQKTIELINGIRGEMGRRGQNNIVRDLNVVYDKLLEVNKDVHRYVKNECAGDISAAKVLVNDIRKNLYELGYGDQAVSINEAHEILNSAGNYMNMPSYPEKEKE